MLLLTHCQKELMQIPMPAYSGQGTEAETTLRFGGPIRKLFLNYYYYYYYYCCCCCYYYCYYYSMIIIILLNQAYDVHDIRQINKAVPVCVKTLRFIPIIVAYRGQIIIEDNVAHVVHRDFSVSVGVILQGRQY